MKTYIKLAISASLAAGGVVAANAQSFSFQSFGSTWSVINGNEYEIEETVGDPGQPLTMTFNYAGAVTNVTQLDYDVFTGPGNIATGNGFFQDATLGTVGFTFSGTFSTTGLPQIAVSDAATVYTLPSGATLQGNISNNLFTVGQTNYEYNTLNAVPEPASFAVVAVGALGILARRRRG